MSNIETWDTEKLLAALDHMEANDPEWIPYDLRLVEVARRLEEREVLKAKVDAMEKQAQFYGPNFGWHTDAHSAARDILKAGSEAEKKAREDS